MQGPRPFPSAPCTGSFPIAAKGSHQLIAGSLFDKNNGHCRCHIAEFNTHRWDDSVISRKCVVSEMLPHNYQMAVSYYRAVSPVGVAPRPVSRLVAIHENPKGIGYIHNLLFNPSALGCLINLQTGSSLPVLRY